MAEPHDIELGATTTMAAKSNYRTESLSSHSNSSELLHEKDIAERSTFFRWFQRAALHCNMEVRGIERVPEDERTASSVYSPAFFWWAVNMVLPAVSIGSLGISAFSLTFWDSTLTIIFFTFLGTLPVAFYSTFGPKFGLRQMILGQIWFGDHLVSRFFAVLNAIGCVGWSALNTIVAASLLHSVNGGAMPAWAGMFVVACGTAILTLFGYKVVHFYERWAWVPTFAVFLVIIACLAKSHTFAPGSLSSGKLEAGNVLSFGATIFGSSTGWATYAADHTVYLPATSSSRKLFLSIFFAISIPLIFTGILGTALMAAAQTTPRLATAYADGGIGGLLYGVMVTNSLHGFGQFCIVLVALSTIAVSCANIYSIAFSVQAISKYFAIIPRVLWTFLGICAFFGLAMGAYYNFEEYMENFMNLIGYWLSIYEAISLSEHFIFRKSSYDAILLPPLLLHAPDDTAVTQEQHAVHRLQLEGNIPPGWAALFAFACGVAGVVVGMYQVWWTGPVAARTSADLGFELAFGFSLAGYLVARPLEKKVFGH
ncbi:permease for cytosine/purines, uracil, thiamine, allantoin-domain-containing protein [Myxozyma melibiosi]|uniref:Permease for cytosine/purines, uracil, thiamine, allantoin-domain-containing protein n=1 Tax=Myxozyma melibiosi TaxID=54550 RepID=A0ABR1FFT0_9ASCO